MSRSMPIVLSLAVLAVSFTAGVARAAGEESKQGDPAKRPPNILLFIADDQNLDSIGAYGAKPSHTPNIDRLAAQSMRFTMAFTPTGMCTPSRSSIFTGLYPVRHGAHPNHASMKPDVRTLPAYLKPAGYRVACFGKAGARPWNFFTWDVLQDNSLPIKGDAAHHTFDYASIAKFLTAEPAKPFFACIASHLPHGPYIQPGGYDASNKFVDSELGHILDLLKQHKLEQDTILVYVSDNGQEKGEESKWTLCDAGVPMPLVVRWPGRVKAGAVTDAMISFTDIVPTLLEAVGVAPPKTGLDGRSFLAVLDGKAARHHEEVVLIQTTMGVNGVKEPYPIRGVRTAKYAYYRYLNSGIAHPKTRDKHPAEELFRMDGNQSKNLVSDPMSKAVLTELRKKVDAWMKQQGDEGLEMEKRVKPRK